MPRRSGSPRVAWGHANCDIDARMSSASSSAPGLRRALVLDRAAPEAAPSLLVREVPAKQPAAGQVVVTLRAAALNRRDVWIRLGKYAGIRLPAVLGSDGAGVVTAIGSGVSDALLGREVIINPSLDWGPSEQHGGESFSVLGMPSEGTFADEICIAAQQIVDKPRHLSWAEAAALPLAGLTAYRALVVRGRLRPGETVLIPGIGSGVSTMALILAKHLGARVIITSGSDEKCQKALSMGADFAVNHRAADWDQRVQKWCGRSLPNLAVDGAGGETWAKCIGLLATSGRMVSYGATAGVATLDLRRLFWRHIDVLGSTMGSQRDFSEMVALFCAGSLRPLIDQVMPLAHAASAFDRMEHGQHMGKIVLAIHDTV